MRAISGWRFALAIVLPIILATVSAVGLTYDLLWQVENGSNAVERMRNTLAVKRAFDTDAKELARLARENAQWDEAVANTSGTVDQEWFRNTWGRSISVGSTYDYAAVIDISSGDILAHNLPASQTGTTIADVTGVPFDALRQRLRRALADEGILSGHVNSKWGPAAVAVAAIRSPSGATSKGTRLLLFLRTHSERRMANLGRQQLLMGLQVAGASAAAQGDLVLDGLAGGASLKVTWLDKNLGAVLTQTAWQKAAIVLGFLVMVMTGIAIVCMRLLRQLSD